MTQFLRYPEPRPMTAEAASRPRDTSGRVLMPIRLEARFLGGSGTGYRRFFDTFDEVAQWMATDEFTATSHALKGLMITRQDPDPGPEVARAARPRNLAAAIHDATTEAE